MSVNPPVVLVLASGRGERFTASGGQVHKLQALLGGRAVLEHTLAAVRASGLPWHLEDAGHPGMGDSIAAAVRATQGAGGWLVLPGDLPLIAPASLHKVAMALAQADVVLPMHGSQRGHPVGFSIACRDALLALSGEIGAAPIVQAKRKQGQVLELALDDVGSVTDIDTLDDLACAEALVQKGTLRRR
ncbi:NTP transferase domain-containing protein [Pseudorhodoferax sp. Leaf267]|uniref:NTP transferase domain-containing protein n=1 Tax=Pseudorhodoferax sp. Leaf267 TaxID=1736316 RepID=UPI0006FF52B9|nr:NTP transferase domain-containing protein [Pseudorhodoferax sp. Leaf267]KQP14712.1 molybdopterin-guanine dinucleotide biosynthesis protein MobA [Pseudorhodoferax sp. Leaf267]